jgi:DNA polymerase elongation subunit (family B)
LRLLTVDIETAPNMAYVWGLWDQNVGLNQIVSSTEMMCWSAKWTDHTKIHYRSTFHDGKEKMVKDLWALLDKADAVIHFNGRRFDIPHINREFLEMGLEPPSPYKQIDLFQAVKRRFRFPSNKLEYVCDRLGIGNKVKHEGFDLWLRCMAGEKSAWDLMKIYNLQDVALTEMLYWKLLPWIPNTPSPAAHSGGEVCPACGSSRLKPRGFAYTSQSQYQRYVCRECGKWSRATTAAKDVDGVRRTVQIVGVAE